MAPAPSPARSARTPLSLGSVGFLLGSCLLLALFIASIGRSRNWWHGGLALEFFSPDLGSIDRGMDVRIAGFKVGHVRAVQLEPDARVRVRLEVRPEFVALVGPRSTATVDQEGLVGSPYVALTADPGGSKRRPLPAGHRLPFRARPDLEDLLVDLAQTRIPLDRALRSLVVLGEQRLPRTLDGVDATVAQARLSARQLDREARFTAAAARATLQRGDRTLAEASRTLQGGDRVLAGPGSLGATLQELRQMATATEAMARRTDALVQRLNGSWLLPMLDGRTPPGLPPAGATKAPPPVGP